MSGLFQRHTLRPIGPSVLTGCDENAASLPQRWWRRARAAEREQASSQAASQQQSATAEAGTAGTVKYFPIRRPTASMRKFLRETTSQELSVARKMASLSAFAYFMSSVTVRSGLRACASLPRLATQGAN